MYYEFQAIDRPLTPEEQAEVGSLSSRTHPTPTRAVFTYSYSDFRGNPIEVLAAYYDAMLYMTNWGSRRLAFRLPRSVIHPERLAPYCIGDLVSTRAHGDHVLLDVNFYEVDRGDWIEGEGWLPSLAPLRRALLRGDFRALYLIWLKAALLEVDYEIEADALEPPVPAGLVNLSAPLRDFVDFGCLAAANGGRATTGCRRSGPAAQGAQAQRGRAGAVWRTGAPYRRVVQQPACAAAALEASRACPGWRLIGQRFVCSEYKFQEWNLYCNPSCELLIEALLAKHLELPVSRIALQAGWKQV